MISVAGIFAGVTAKFSPFFSRAFSASLRDLEEVNNPVSFVNIRCINRWHSRRYPRVARLRGWYLYHLDSRKRVWLLTASKQPAAFHPLHHGLTENDKKLAFLDTEVLREPDGRLTTSVYRRPVHTDQYLAYDSHHPQSIKRGIVNCLYERAKRLVTKPSNISKEKKKTVICTGF